jgi:hypothetical protein
MKNSIDLIAQVYITKKALVYEGCLGVEELFKFYRDAPEETKDEFDELLNSEEEKDRKRAIGILEKFLGILEGELYKCMFRDPRNR